MYVLKPRGQISNYHLTYSLLYIIIITKGAYKIEYSFITKTPTNIQKRNIIMKKYKDFNRIRKQEISEFHGLENEVTFSPYKAVKMRPMRLSKFGITYPNPSYYIKREPAPCFIIEYIVSGRGYLEINDEKYKLNPGDAYIIHPGDFCTYYADKNEPYKKYWINFSADFFFTEMLKAYGIEDRVFRGLDLSGFFESLFKLEDVSDTNDELFIPASKLVFSAMMDIALHKENDTVATGYDLAYKVRNMLYKSISTRITIDDIAKKLYRSKNDINRQFKKQYNTTPHNFLVELRITKAKNMLVNSRKTIAEIANLLCFSSEFHFSNTFKKKVGISPSEFRRNMTEQKRREEDHPK